MTYDRIIDLARTLPAAEKKRVTQDEQDPGVALFLYCYTDLHFAFTYAKTMAEHRKPLPAHVNEDEVRRCYYWYRFKKTDSELTHVMALRHPSQRFFTNTMEAMFMAEDVDSGTVAKEVGLPEPVVHLYEKLFFNVVDRRRETAFIARIAYPEHRYQEFKASEMKNTGNQDLLKRAGFNNGIEDVLFFSGLSRGSPILNITNADLSERFENVVLNTGLLLARNGYVHSRDAHVVGSAKGLLAAAKQGGQDGGNTDREGIGSLGEAMSQQMADFFADDMKKTLEKRQQIGVNSK